MEIEEVTQAEAKAVSAPQEQHAEPGNPREAQSPGLMQSVIGAAKSLLGGRPDEVHDSYSLWSQLCWFVRATFALLSLMHVPVTRQARTAA